jgi:hypothetical protein
MFTLCFVEIKEFIDIGHKYVVEKHSVKHLGVVWYKSLKHSIIHRYYGKSSYVKKTLLKHSTGNSFIVKLVCSDVTEEKERFRSSCLISLKFLCFSFLKNYFFDISTFKIVQTSDLSFQINENIIIIANNIWSDWSCSRSIIFDVLHPVM